MKFEYSEQKLTQFELNEFEKQFRIKLPDSYKKVILEYNGGIAQNPYFRGGMAEFLPIKYGDWTIEKALNSDRISKSFLPFADYGGTSYCINLNSGNDYGKIYWVNEGGETELVCNSFEDFISELSDSPDY